MFVCTYCKKPASHANHNWNNRAGHTYQASDEETYADYQAALEEAKRSGSGDTRWTGGPDGTPVKIVEINMDEGDR